MCVRLGALTANVGKGTCTCGGRRYRGETKIIGGHASEELRKSSLAHLKRFQTLEQVLRMQTALIREGPTKETATLTSKYPEDVKPSRKFRPHTHSFKSRKKCAIHTIATITQGVRLAGATDGPTDTRKTVKDVGAGGTTAPTDAACVPPPFPFLCPCLWAWFDRQKTRRVQVKTQPQTKKKKTKACLTSVAVAYPCCPRCSRQQEDW